MLVRSLQVVSGWAGGVFAASPASGGGPLPAARHSFACSGWSNAAPNVKQFASLPDITNGIRSKFVITYARTLNTY